MQAPNRGDEFKCLFSKDNSQEMSTPTAVLNPLRMTESI